MLHAIVNHQILRLSHYAARSGELTVSPCNIINQQCSSRPPKITPGYTSKTLSPCGIPALHFDPLSLLAYSQYPAPKLNTKGWFCKVKTIIGQTNEKWWFADGGVADQDVFEDVVPL